MAAIQNRAPESATKVKLRVLLVDDDHEDSILFARCADRIDDYDVEVCWTNDYDDALQLIRRESFDVHFIDFRLGRGSGMELMSRVLELDPRKALVLLTGFGDKTVAAECRRRGARGYLSKTNLNPDALAQCLRVCTGAPAGSAPAPESGLFDELPGIYRLEAFLDAANQALEAERGARGHQAVLIVDIDDYAGLVRQEGEEAGRKTMRVFSGAVRDCLRHSDMIGRYGPDKLCVLTHAWESWMAAELAEQIRGSVEYKTGVTASIGVAHAPSEGAQVNTLLSRANAAKALAQQKGRNRVEMVSMSMRLPSVPSDGDSP